MTVQAKLYWADRTAEKALIRLGGRGKAAGGKIAVVLKERLGTRSPGVVKSKKVEELVW